MPVLSDETGGTLDPLERERRRILEAYERRESRLAQGVVTSGIEDTAHRLRLRERYRLTFGLLDELTDRPRENLRALDLGCGDGAFLRELLDRGFRPDHLTGIDLRPPVLERARARLPGLRLELGCASRLSLPPASMNLIFAHTVFSSILLKELRESIRDEIERVLAPGGRLVLYDFFRKNPRNPDVVALSLEELIELFSPLHLEASRRLTFRVDHARKIPGPLLRLLYPLLARLDSARTHHLLVFRKGPRSPVVHD